MVGPTPERRLSGSRFKARGTPFRKIGFAGAQQLDPPPIILEWSSKVVRVGYAEQYRPQHILPLPETNKNWTASQWYASISPVISLLFDRLMVDSTSRKVVCVCPPFSLRVWEEALRQILWNCGVPAVSFVNSLEMVPPALGLQRGIVVQVGYDQAHCLAFADGHSLSFTYQAVPAGYATAVPDSSVTKCEWNAAMEKCWLDESHPHSLMSALLNCLYACPKDILRDVVSNICICGDALVLVPGLHQRVGVRLKRILKQTPSTDPASAFGSEEVDPNLVLTVVPVKTTSLVSLSDRVGIVTTAPYRADLITWVGASLWTAVWHRHDDGDKRLQWIKSPLATA